MKITKRFENESKINEEKRRRNHIFFNWRKCDSYVFSYEKKKFDSFQFHFFPAIFSPAVFSALLPCRAMTGPPMWPAMPCQPACLPACPPACLLAFLALEWLFFNATICEEEKVKKVCYYSRSACVRVWVRVSATSQLLIYLFIAGTSFWLWVGTLREKSKKIYNKRIKLTNNKKDSKNI